MHIVGNNKSFPNQPIISDLYIQRNEAASINYQKMRQKVKGA